MPKKKTTPKRSPSSAETKLHQLDKQYLWHPFTQMRDWQQEPQVIRTRRGKHPGRHAGEKVYRRGFVALGHGAWSP